MPLGDFYAVLSVPRDASPADIRVAYRRAIKVAHPDRGGDAAEFDRIQRAYAALKDPQSRAAYDRALSDPAPVVEPEPDDEPWGVQDTFQPPPSPAGVPQPPATPRPLTWTAFWPKWRVATIIGLLVAAVLMSMASVATQAGSATVLVGFAAMVAVPLRVFRRRGWFALIVEIVTVVLAWALAAGQMSWPYQPVMPLLIALAAFTAGELARPAMRRRTRAATRARQAQANAWLAQHWDAMISASRTHGALYWISRAQVHGELTTALLFDPATSENVTRQLWGRWASGSWVVVDRAGAVVKVCGDDARVAWETVRASRV